MQDTLPEKLSDLTDLALNDLDYCEHHPEHYRINMHFWHTAPDEMNPRCQICLAGAVIAKTLETKPEEEVRPNYFRRSINNKLSALDSLRQGHVMNAMQAMGIFHTRCPNGEPLVNVPDYDANREGFKRALRQLAADFRAMGL